MTAPPFRSNDSSEQDDPGSKKAWPLVASAFSQDFPLDVAVRD